MYKGCQFALLVWRCLCIGYEIDVISGTVSLGGFATEVFLLSKGLDLSMNQLHKIFWAIYFLEEYWKKETYETFRLHKYANVLQLPIVDIAAVLYVVCKYLFFLLLDRPFLQSNLLCILGEWQHKLNDPFQS